MLRTVRKLPRATLPSKRGPSGFEERSLEQNLLAVLTRTANQRHGTKTRREKVVLRIHDRYMHAHDAGILLHMEIDKETLDPGMSD